KKVNGPGNGSLMNLKDGYMHVAGIGGIDTNMGWGLSYSKMFAPRIGAAWQMNPKTVIRAGYGRSFDIGVFGSIFGHVVTQNLPVLANQSVSGPNPATAAFTLAQGPPAFVFPTVPSNGLLPAPGYNVSVKARPNTLRLPTLDAWNLSVRRAITPTMGLTIAYVGNKGTHTLSSGDGNNTNPNEAGIFLPAEYSITGTTLHYDPSVPATVSNTFNGRTVTGIAADSGTASTNYLQRFYAGGLAACTNPSYEAAVLKTDPNLQPGMCGWSQGISYYGDDQDTNFNALQI